MKRTAFIAMIIAFSLSASACSDSGTEGISPDVSDSGSVNSSDAANGSAENVDFSQMFSNRDFETDYDKNNSVTITLNGNSVSCDSDFVQVSGSSVTVSNEGTYILSGTLDDGMIIVNTEKTEKVQLVLNNVEINSETSAPIYVRQSDKVFITLADDSVNTLSNGGTFTAIDENNIDSVIFSKEDITLNGSGSLTVESPAGHGIVSKDELTVTGGTYTINSASHGLSGKDNVCIANADFTVTSGKDGIQADNSDDASLGFVYIQSGTFDISAEGDGISASAYMQIEDGSFNILSGGGSENAEKLTSDSWGNFMGGGRGGMGGGMMGGGMNPRMPVGGMVMPNVDNVSMNTGFEGLNASTAAAEGESTSIKGIKATGNIVINSGSFTIDSADDSVHSNSSVTVNGGTFEISSDDDAFHADDTLTVTSGAINITESYEGLEGLHVSVSGGDIRLAASDDGVNAAGGTDSSGFGGFRGNDMFGGRGGGMGAMGGASSGGSITVSGGTLYINSSGDGFDANGTLTISGGDTIVCGPTMGDTATLDYDLSGIITGGTFIGTGASNMAQTFSDSEQGVISVSVGNQAAGTEIILKDKSGNVVLTHTPELSFAVVILSSPEIISGETYTLSIGTISEDFTAE